ncbi:hypothetical protein AAZX31_03G201900 [Glycine max]|nr:hypothetical protein GLYMA_03G221850v4 [Glycine max]KAH1071272.1 hypothetical protein GYH30_008028 [Glycine max]
MNSICLHWLSIWFLLDYDVSQQSEASESVYSIL